MPPLARRRQGQWRARPQARLSCQLLRRVREGSRRQQHRGRLPSGRIAKARDCLVDHVSGSSALPRTARPAQKLLACAYRKLSPDLLMMEPAEDRYRCDAAELLGSSKIWSIFIQ